MNNIYYYNFNNYYNRIIKFFATLTEYSTYQVGSPDSAINFNPNDDVNAELICNRTPTDIGDYLIIADDYGIVSRWFILEKKRLRNGQYKMMLRRDLISDYYSYIITAPAFIEKATLDNTDPMIFNSEEMTFNQIKTSETPLRDETGCAWVVGYIPKDALHSNTIHGDVILDYAYDYEYSTLADFPLYDLINQTYNGKQFDVVCQTFLKQANAASYIRVRVDWDISDGSVSRYIINFNENTTSLTHDSGFDYQNLYGGFSIFHNYNYDAYTNYSGNVQTNPTIDEFLSYNNKVIKVGGIYYRVNITRSDDYYNGTTYIPANSQLGSDLWALMNHRNITGTPNDESFRLSYNYYTYVLTLDQIFTDAVVTINDTRYHLEDQPYDMFCIPYSNDLKIYKNGTQLSFTANKSIAVNMAISIATSAGTGSIYDVQLLPYCPVRYMIKSDGKFDIGDARVHYVKDGNGNNIGVICWATQSQFTLEIEHTITVTDPKVENLTDLYRLCSPNFNGQFDFSAAKNGGVSSFNVDCNYKPFNPYIHVNPNFGKLYGQDFNDARGLICAGDFSLPQLSNAWADYELQNKNYQNIFNRQIENMEVNNKYQNIQSAISGISGAVSGAMLGNIAGGPAGAVIGGIASLAGGAADLAIQKALQNEALDYKKDMFGYQLGNIKAIPTNLTKTSAFTANNKIFPILEYYTCTDIEKQALRDKLAYNGMTVMRIGTVEQFIRQNKTYIKAKIIRIEELAEDTHVLNEIANEMYKGVFI